MSAPRITSRMRCPPSPAEMIAAPAASPKMKQVARRPAQALYMVSPELLSPELRNSDLPGGRLNSYVWCPRNSHLLLAQCDKPQGVWGTGPPVRKTLPSVHSQLANSSTPKLNVTLNQNNCKELLRIVTNRVEEKSDHE